MPPLVIDYYVSTSSPWAYLGHAVLHDIARLRGAHINYKPLPLRSLFEQSGGLPLARRHPSRQRYRTMELHRWREQRGLTIHLAPTHSPFEAALADRVVITLAARGVSPEHFLALTHAGVWEKNRNLADAEVLADTLRAAGHDDPAAILLHARAPESEATYTRNLADALAAGVFGAPSYVVNGEVFWGQDRLDLLDAMLESGRKPYPSS